MAESTTIQINFGKPMPIFPLDSVALLPQQVLNLHIFEPRYRQMLEHVLDSSGQFAMATFSGNSWKQNYHGRPSVRPAVCIGHILEHEKTADGNYNVALHGLKRARILYEMPPSLTHLYREAMLEPVGEDEPDPESLQPVRDQLDDLFSHTSLKHLRAARPFLQYLQNEQVPTAVILDLIAFKLLSDREMRYTLLAESDTKTRTSLILNELSSLQTLIERAQAQHPEEWPRGCSWN